MRARPLRFGLAQRTMLLLVAAVFGSLAVLAAGFGMQRRDDFADFADARARAIAAQVHSIRLVLESVPAASRRSVSEGLRHSGTVNVFPSGEVDTSGTVAAWPPARPGLLARLTGVEPADPAAVMEAVRRYARQPAEVRYGTGQGSGYWVRQQIDGQAWWIVVLAGALPAEPGGVPWLVVLALLLALLGIAALYAASITRPLRRLAVATHRIGDSWPGPVSVEGPAELRDLALSFNAMLTRLRQIEDERRVLLGGLPHDLRAPLTRLRLRLATLTEAGEHPGIADDIAAVDHIVRQFTEYLRGVQPDEPRQSLREIVRSSVGAYRSLGRDVRIEDEDEVPQDRVPQFAVRRLLDNLVENALQHGREPVQVRVAVAAAGLLELRVSDRGEGIPDDTAEMALEPFTKLDPARGRGGCGLGLAIVRQLTRQLGGSVRFERRLESFSVVACIGVE